MITEKTLGAVNTTGNREKQIVGISVDFLKEAYNAACAEWKKKIKNEFPEIFSPLITIKELGECFYNDEKIKIFDSGNYIFLKLPNANTKWTQRAFQWCLVFLDKEKEFTIFHPGKQLEVIRASCGLDPNQNWLLLTNQKGIYD